GASGDVLNEVTFHAYTDLLLHDLGPELADADGEGAATAREWRTPPLWGLGLVAEDPRARFLHDARAATFEDAIRWHGGEAHASRNRFEALGPEDQLALLAFLRSL
ncbi:MAG TPA: di-heme oxidoredictase family protein, partial [Archangium sp.]